MIVSSSTNTPTMSASATAPRRAPVALRPPTLLLSPPRARLALGLVARADASSSSSPTTTATTTTKPQQRPKSRNSTNGRASPSPPTANTAAASAAREQQLWDRQVALMEREQRRWDQERAAWRAREAALLQELAETRKALVAVAVAAATANGGSGGAASAAASAATAAPPATSAPSAASVASSASPAWAGLFDQVQSGGEPTVSSKAPADASADANADDADEEARVSSSIAAAMNAAMAAVKELDVLSSETDAFLASALAGSGRGGSSSSSSASSTSGALPAIAADPAKTDQEPPPPPPPPVETPRGDPEGPPPVLSAGDDDIYWMDRLHAALSAAGFYPPDEEVEAWIFGPGTTTALLTFQACGSLPETGCADEATWRALLGDEEVDKRLGAAAAPAAAAAASPATPAPAPAPAPAQSNTSTNNTKEPSWPIIAEMDGGKAVHRLQVALSAAGFHCGEDEMQWWQFGSTTLESLRTFQACGGLPETGVTCARTWRALLGPDARPEDLEKPVGKGEAEGEGGTYDEDLTIAAGEGRVWLLGEQRWSRPLRGGDGAC